MSIANPQFDKAAISAIVREVLRRVTTSQQMAPPPPTTPAAVSAVAMPPATAPSVGFPSKPLPTVQSENTTYECDSKLVAMATLRGKLDNIKTLRVKPKTIVTPAVRDELRDRKIKIVFDLRSDDRACPQTQKTILLGTTCNSTGTRLRDQLSSKGVKVQLQTNNCIKQLAKTVADSVSATMRALIVSDQPFSTACHANRNANVQAAVIRDQADASAAKLDLNPNCIVLSSQTALRLNLPSILQQLNW